VPDTLNVAFTSPERALKVEADADGTEKSSEANTIEATSPDRIDAVALDKVDPFLLVEMKLSALILATSDVLSCAVIKLQKPSNNYATRCCSAPF
jgi:hypothetical protein